MFNWSRDAAVTAIELVAAGLPTSQPLIDYTSFAWTCQQAPAPNDRACYTIEGLARDSSDQSDGPALRTIALVQAYPLLDSATQAMAQAVIAQDLTFLLGAYQSSTYNLWEEHSGYSFFARSVQLRCLQEVKANSLGIPVPAGIDQGTPDRHAGIPGSIQARADHACSVWPRRDGQPNFRSTIMSESC